MSMEKWLYRTKTCDGRLGRLELDILAVDRILRRYEYFVFSCVDLVSFGMFHYFLVSSSRISCFIFRAVSVSSVLIGRETM